MYLLYTYIFYTKVDRYVFIVIYLTYLNNKKPHVFMKGIEIKTLVFAYV